MRLSQGTAVITLSQGMSSALGVAFGILLARLLGPSGKGVFAVLVAIMSVVSAIGNFGFARANLYYFGQRKERRKALLANSFWMALGAGTLSGGAAYLLLAGPCRALLGDIEPRLLGIMLLVIPFLFFNTYSQSMYLGMGAILPCQLTDMTAKLTQLIAVAVGLLAFHTDIGGVVAIFVGNMVFVSFLYGGGLVRRVGGITLRPDLALWRETLRYSGRAWAVTIVNFVMMRVDLLFVYHLMGAAAAGFYSVATTVVDVLLYVPTAVGAQITPRLAAAGGVGETERTARAARVMVVVLLAATAGIALVAQPLARLLYGPAFLAAVPPMWTLLPAAVLACVQNLLQADLAGRGFPPQLLGCWIPALVLNLLLQRVAISMAGMPGAAAATSLAYLTVCILTAILFSTRTGQPLRSLLPGPRDVADAVSVMRRLATKG